MRGGRRDGAGRPKGARTKRKAAYAIKAAAEGKQPIDVMLEAMRDQYAQGHLVAAAAIAKDIAPYVHPRRLAIGGDPNGAPIRTRALTDDQIGERIGRLVAKAVGQTGGHASH